MSEFISGNEQLPHGLMEFARGITSGADARDLIREHRRVIDAVTPHQTMTVLDNLLREGFTVTETKAAVGKILNMFHMSLASYEWEKPGNGHFLHHLMLENREAEKRMETLRSLTKRFFHGKEEERTTIRQAMLDTVMTLEPYELHYIKKENILFPYIEKHFPQYGCIKVMWAFHDDFRHSIIRLREILSGPDWGSDDLNRELGRLFFTVVPVIFREEQILFPVVIRALPEESWDEMMTQANEAGWCYIPAPTTVIKQPTREDMGPELTDLVTGALSAEQLVLMLDALPVDITYVDEEDCVRYFSGEKHRLFPRSKAIIGRKVQNCHPPDSVDVVEKILEAFRNREKDHADFWITMKGRFIHIRYFALYDAAGKYRGTIEVSQDVTEIRSLEGEKRLLDWE